MKLVAPFALLLAAVGLAQASSIHAGVSDLQKRHHQVARQHEQLESRAEPIVVVRRDGKRKRCTVKAQVRGTTKMFGSNLICVLCSQLLFRM